MNKEIKRVSGILDEKKAHRDEVIAKARADLKATNEKLSVLRKELDKAEDSEQFKTILHDVKDNEAVLEFCEKRLHEAESESLSDTEYKEIIYEVSTAYKAIKEEHMKSINGAIDKLLKLLDVYDNEVSELNDIIDRAGELHQTNFSELVTTKINPRAALIEEIRNPLHPYRLYIDDFYKLKLARATNVL